MKMVEKKYNLIVDEASAALPSTWNSGLDWTTIEGYTMTSTTVYNSYVGQVLHHL